MTLAIREGGNTDLSQRILLYGDSLILGTMGTSLRRYPQFEVTMLTPPLPETREMAALHPDVVLFDLELSHAEAVFPLLESFPRLLLIGISPDTNLVKVWSGKQLREMSTRDLLEVINKQANNSHVP